jgi:RimJ/RimL family protein N-acetyltransferase
MADVTTQTERLIIRRFHAADAAAFAAYRCDPQVARYQSWSAPFPQEEAERLVATFASGDCTEPGWFQYAIALRDSDLLIGDIGVNLQENRMQAEIGFTLATPWQGKGYAYEALRRMLDHLFTERNLHRVSAECDARNVRSARLLGRLGFAREGCRRRHTFIKGEWTDDLLFGLLAGEWQQIMPRSAA